jgi:cyclohexadieny/prephenate dehydrogenase
VDAPPFERLGIVGLGLVGGSVALAAKRRWPSIQITVCDPAPVALEAVTQGLVTAVVGSPEELAGCDLIVIATPVHLVPEVVARLSAAGVAGLVTDTGSTKRTVMTAAQSAPGLAFVGGHPVAASEASGLAAARADLFDGRPWVLVSGGKPEHEVREAMLASFVVGLGARPEWTDAVTHDRVMATVSQAPHVVSSAVKAVPAASDVWQGILETNADFIADALVAIAAKLPTSSSALTDTPEVRDVFERAKALKALKARS